MPLRSARRRTTGRTLKISSQYSFSSRKLAKLMTTCALAILSSKMRSYTAFVVSTVPIDSSRST